MHPDDPRRDDASDDPDRPSDSDADGGEPDTPDDDDSDAGEPSPRPTRGLEILDMDEDFDDEEDEDGDYDEFEEEDEEDEDDVRAVLITGSSGNLGRKLRAAWDDLYDLVLIDREKDADDDETIVVDLTSPPDDWLSHFHGVDTVIHLAGNPDEFASWEDLQGPNLDAMANVLNACVLAGVERVVFASSNHAMGGYREIVDIPITTSLPPRPDGPYGASKLVGERLGRSLAESFDLTFIALRLGWIQPGSNLPETLPDDWARAMWLSNGDLVRLFECAVETELEDRQFLVANGMSNNAGSRWDLTEAVQLLGYTPEDDAYAEGL